MAKKTQTKTTAKPVRAKKAKKQLVFCYWADVKYSVGAIHVHNGREYMCDYKGRWM